MANPRLRPTNLHFLYRTRGRQCQPSNIGVRAFTQSSKTQGTILRAPLWDWLEGPGRAFKNPPSKPNYLGAYDRSGRPTNPARNAQRQDDDEDEDDEDDEDDEHSDEDVENRDEEDEEDDREGLEEEDDAADPTETEAELQRPRASELRPFPLNKDFRSEAVLSEALRDEIFQQVVGQSKTIREVSANLHVDMRRVGAVVRLKTIELDWIRKGKPLAMPYAKAVLAMLPQTPLKTGTFPSRHESINDLPVHAATTVQLFHPTSESRTFTRVDAGKAFHPKLLPADARIPHPELIAQAKDKIDGIPARQRIARHAERLSKDAADRKEERRAAEEAEAKQTTVVQGRRWDFKFRDINAESVGKDGRSPNGVGWRYGMPHEDRKRGQVKIPTSVP